MATPTEELLAKQQPKGSPGEAARQTEEERKRTPAPSEKPVGTPGEKALEVGVITKPTTTPEPVGTDRSKPAGWLAVAPKYAELHPEAVIKHGDWYYRPPLSASELRLGELQGKTKTELMQEKIATVEGKPALQYAKQPEIMDDWRAYLTVGDANKSDIEILRILRYEAQAPLVAQIKFINESAFVKSSSAFPQIAKEINAQIIEYNTLSGEAQFDKAKELGFIPKDVVYADLGEGGWSYKTPLEALKTTTVLAGAELSSKAYQVYEKQLEEFKRDNVELSDGNWITKESYDKMPSEIKGIVASAGLAGLDIVSKGLQVSAIPINYEKYQSADPQGKFDMLVASGLIPQGSKFAGLDDKGDVTYYPEGEDKANIPIMVAEMLVPGVYTAKHWDEMPWLPSLTDKWYYEDKQVTQDERNKIISDWEAKRNKLIQQGKVLSEDWLNLGSSPVERMSRVTDVGLLETKAASVGMDVLSLLPVVGAVGKIGSVSARTLQGVSAVDRAAQTARSTGYLVKAFAKGALWDFPKGMLTHPVRTLKGLAEITVEPIIHPVRTAKTLVGVTRGEIQLGNFISEGTMVSAGRLGRTVPGFEIETIGGKPAKVFNFSGVTEPTIQAEFKPSAEYNRLVASKEIPGTINIENGVPYKTNLTPQEYEMFKLVKQGYMPQDPETDLLLKPPELAKLRLGQIKGFADNYGYDAAIEMFGREPVKIVFPDINSRLKAEQYLRASIKPTLETIKENALDAGRRFANYLATGEKTLGWGSEQEWLKLAQNGYIAAPQNEQWELIQPSREQIIAELARIPFDATYSEAGVWKVEPQAFVPRNNLIIQYPVYLADPSIISAVFDRKMGKIYAYGETGVADVVDRDEWDKGWQDLMAKGLVSEIKPKYDIESRIPKAEIITNLPEPMKPIMNESALEELIKLFNEGTIVAEFGDNIYTIKPSGQLLSLGGASNAEKAQFLVHAITQTIKNQGYGMALRMFGMLPVLAVYPYAIPMALAEEEGTWQLSVEDRRALLDKFIKSDSLQQAINKLSPLTGNEVQDSLSGLAGRFSDLGQPKTLAPDTITYRILNPKSELPITSPEAQLEGAVAVAELPSARLTEQILTNLEEQPQVVPMTVEQPVTIPEEQEIIGLGFPIPKPYESPFEREITEFEKAPQRQPQPQPLVQPKPQPQPLPQPIPEPLPEPLPQPIPEPIPEPLPQPIPQPIPVPTPTPVPVPIPEPQIPPPPITKIGDGAGEGKRYVPKRATIVWRQGMKWSVLPPRDDGSYHQEDMKYLDLPPVGTYKFATGKGSAYATLQVLGGAPTKDASVDLGWAQVDISGKTKELTMTFSGGKEAAETRWEGIDDAFTSESDRLLSPTERLIQPSEKILAQPRVLKSDLLGATGMASMSAEEGVGEVARTPMVMEGAPATMGRSAGTSFYETPPAVSEEEGEAIIRRRKEKIPPAYKYRLKVKKPPAYTVDERGRVILVEEPEFEVQPVVTAPRYETNPMEKPVYRAKLPLRKAPEEVSSIPDRTYLGRKLRPTEIGVNI